MSRLTIALSGLSDTDAAMFEAALDALPDRKWVLVEGNQANLLVVDIDTVWGHMDWLRATANGQQVVAYTKDGNVRHCELVLTKPLHASDLSDLLDDMGSGTAAHPVTPEAATCPAATQAPARPPTAEIAAATVPEPAIASLATPPPAPAKPLPPMTLGECLLADKLVQACSLQDADGTVLQLDPERGGYTGPATLKPLKSLLDMPMEQARPMPPDAIKSMREMSALPLTRLLWFAALSATPGELAPNLDREGRYHLSRWPQIEREFPRHFRIATSMMKGPGTLDDIASLAHAPVGDVADFINAYSVAGYVTCEGAATADDDAAENSNRMFSRLRRPFARNGQQEAS